MFDINERKIDRPDRSEERLWNRKTFGSLQRICTIMFISPKVNKIIRFDNQNFFMDVTDWS